MNNNRVKIRFNEQRDSIEVTQDDVDIEIEFAYKAYMVPPVFADRGRVKVAVQDVGFTADIGVETGAEGRAVVQITQMAVEWVPEKIDIQIECYSDMTRYIADDLIFH